MRFAEINIYDIDNLKAFVTNEENEVLKKFDNDEYIWKKDLNEREQEIMNYLVRKSFVKRNHHNDRIYYKKL